jgi:transposase
LVDRRISRFLAKQIRKASAALQPPYEELVKQLPKEDHVHADETGSKTNGDLGWTWCLRARNFTVFRIDSSRGSIVLETLLGLDYSGTISSDFWSAYLKFARLSKARSQYCWAHLIRDVKYLANFPDAKVSRYGHRLLSAIQQMFSTIHRRGAILDRHWFLRMYRHRESILKESRCRVPKNKDALNLSERLRNDPEGYFRFIESGIPPTNNLAEQSIRRVVINRKVTQGTRSDWGNRWWERIWSVMATCEQQGKNIMVFLKSAIDSLFHGLDPPKLLEK